MLNPLLDVIRVFRYFIIWDIRVFNRRPTPVLWGCIVLNLNLYFLVFFAYGIIPLRGMDSATVTVKNPTPTYEDPLAQRGFASYKMWYAALRLNEAWMVRIEAAASA